MRRNQARTWLTGLTVLTVLAVLALVLPVVTAHDQPEEGGPDGFGYRYEEAKEPYPNVVVPGPEDVVRENTGISTHTIRDETGLPVGPEERDKLGPYAIGFPFPFYEERYSTVYVCQQGYLTFSEDTPCTGNPYEGGSGDDPPALDNIVLPIVPGGSPYSIAVRASAGHGSGSDLSPSSGPFAVEFSAITDCTPSGGIYLDLTVELFPNGTIEVHKGHWASTPEECYATDEQVGIVSPDGSHRLVKTPYEDHYHGHFSGSDGMVTRYAPPCQTSQRNEELGIDLQVPADPLCIRTGDVTPDADPIAAGDDHVCTLLETGDVHCWPGNEGKAEDYTGGDAIGVDAGKDVTCFLVEGTRRSPVEPIGDPIGEVTCQGETSWSYSQGDIADLAVGGEGGNLCVMLENGDVHCETGRGSALPGYDGGDAIDVDVGSGGACITNGDVECWGFGSDPGPDPSEVNDVGDSVHYVEVAVGSDGGGVCAFDGRSRTVVCSGIESGVPVPGTGLDLDAGEDRACVVDASGVGCPDPSNGWDTSGDERQPTHVAVNDDHDQFQCALLDDGNVRCWGSLEEDYTGGDAGRWGPIDVP